jgi:hypothetical protein
MNLTPNQTVAWRVHFARRLRNWTQEETVEQLEAVGIQWSPDTLSNIEQSVTGKRPKNFSADELVAIIQDNAFPVQWFLCPPAHDPYGLLPTISPRPGKVAMTPDELVACILDPHGLVAQALVDADGLSAATRARLPQPPE